MEVGGWRRGLPAQVRDANIASTGTGASKVGQSLHVRPAFCRSLPSVLHGRGAKKTPCAVQRVRMSTHTPQKRCIHGAFRSIGAEFAETG